MKHHIFQFEMRSWMKSPVLWLLVLFFSLFPLIAMLGTGGYFDATEAGNEGLPVLNSPYALTSNMFLFAKMLLLVVALVAGTSLYRDYHSRMHTVLYSFPIPKRSFFIGKLGSALFILCSFCLLIALSMFAGELILGTENTQVSTFNILAYGVAIGVYLIPTVLATSVIIFVVVGTSRNIYSAFVGVICIALIPLLLNNLLFKYPAIIGLLDPFGQSAFFLATEEWDMAKKNSTALPLGIVLLANRLLWLSIAIAMLLIFYSRFDFQHDQMFEFQFPKKRKRIDVALNQNSAENRAENECYTTFSRKAKLGAMWYLLKYHFLGIISNWGFWLISGFGVFTVFFIQLKATQTGAFTILPLTRILIGPPLQIYSLIIILCTFLFSGFLLQRASKAKMKDLIDVTPVDNWQLQFAKTGAIGLMQLTQLLIFLFTSIFIQLINGYFQFELGLYLFHLIVLIFPMLLLWNITSQFVYTLFPNLYLGLLIILSLWFFPPLLDHIGLSNYQFKLNTLPDLEYSDFYGYLLLSKYRVFLIYWLVFGIILFICTSLIWNRGRYHSIKELSFIALSRMKRNLVVVMAVCLVAFAGLFAQMQQADEDSDPFSKDERNDVFEAYKTQWQAYKHIVQPQIVDIALNIDLYPASQDFQASGSYLLVNKGSAPLDTILIRTGFDEITRLDWKGHAILLKEDSLMKNYLYKLLEPLPVGDTIELDFELRNTPNVLLYRNSNVLTNGTFIRNDILPRIGYQFVEHELPLTDSSIGNVNYFSRDADLVNISTNISTSGEQMAIAPGELISSSEKDGRRSYEYASLHPVKFNFSFHSSAYMVMEERHKGINIQILFQKGHDHNIEMMMEGIKGSLDFNSALFGKYPYQSIRIVEFPHTEGGFSATLMSNNIPSSEQVFVINTKAMADDINLPFYIMAHELTHEWFGNQLIPADREGSRMLTESITEYLSLCIYREEFGEEMAVKFLQKQYERYKRGSRREPKEEPPLYQVLSHQEYLSYGKGAIALNEISKTMGRDKFNKLLSEFWRKFGNKSDYFPLSLDFIEFLKLHAPQHAESINYWLIEKHEIPPVMIQSN